MQNNTNMLAIVIPFYKLSYFDEVLSSLARQTNNQFRVYIGDDCSSSDPSPTIEKYRDKLSITYHRFDERLGHISLTQQWERCLKLVETAEWVWVLPDDDYPSTNVVESFYTALDSKSLDDVNVVRLPIQVIDKDGVVVKKPRQEPVVETNYELYSRIIRGETTSSLGDNIFRFSALQQSGGFVDLPKAWGSDHATILSVSAGSKIYCLNKTYLGFRLSGENISSDRSDGREKMAARVKFAQWLKANEQIFPIVPDKEFYRYFYWKGEFYFLHHFNFDYHVLLELYKLRQICLNTRSLRFLPKILLARLSLLFKENSSVHSRTIRKCS